MAPELSVNAQDGAVPDSLVVVSNREPYSHERDDDGEIRVQSAAGGLTSALDPVMQSRGGTWVAWGSGDADMAVAEEGIVEVPPSDPAYDLKRVPLSDAAVQAITTATPTRCSGRSATRIRVGYGRAGLLGAVPRRQRAVC